MAKLSPSQVREAETAAKAESMKRFSQDIGCPITDKQAHDIADKRVRDSCERRSRRGK